jgi:hypothetical protein
MKYIWTPTINDILEAIELAQSRGVKPGESYEKEFLEIMAKNNKKPNGATELNKEEIIREMVEKNGNILVISINTKGEQTYNIIKKNDSHSI